MSLRLVKLAFALGLATAIACSKTSASGPCETSRCVSGNQCLDDGAGTSCHLVCATQKDCPFNYYCTPSLSSTDAGVLINYCASDAVSYKDGPGTWGASCNPTGGITTNPGCDVTQKFVCYAENPTDANALCTQDCTIDTDCPGGWWCATVNLSPNASTTTRSTGQTIQVCKPRGYCAPCTADIDCSQATGPEHCIPDENGNFYCAPECTEDSNCDNEAACVTLAAAGSDHGTTACNGTNTPCVCQARAEECVGDGNLCSPCLSDADCPMGLCVQADYSTEHFCTVASGTPCSIDANGQLVDQCPSTDEAMADVGCTTSPDGDDAPQNQCVGLRTLGTNPETGKTDYVLGCFTPNR